VKLQRWFSAAHMVYPVGKVLTVVGDVRIGDEVVEVVVLK
jgi:hypothetical protein